MTLILLVLCSDYTDDDSWDSKAFCGKCSFSVKFLVFFLISKWNLIIVAQYILNYLWIFLTRWLSQGFPLCYLNLLRDLILNLSQLLNVDHEISYELISNKLQINKISLQVTYIHIFITVLKSTVLPNLFSIFSMHLIFIFFIF